MIKKLLSLGAKGIVLLAYCIAVTALFLWLLFPGAFMQQWIADYSQSLLSQYRIVPGHMRWQFPGKVLFSNVKILDSGRKTTFLAVDYLQLSPDYQSIIKGSLGFSYDASLYNGFVKGTVKPLQEKGGCFFTGLVQDIKLEKVEALVRRFKRKASGIASGTFSVRTSLSEPMVVQGQAKIENGEISLQQRILEHEILPFSRISCGFSGSHKLELSNGVVESPLFTGTFTGDLQLVDALEKSRIELNGKMQPQPSFFPNNPDGRELASMYNKFGEGGVDFTIRGLLQRPGIRFTGLDELSRLLKMDIP